MEPSFLWPESLWGLILVPVLLAVYRALHRRRPGSDLIHPDLGLIATAAAHARPFRRHVAAGMFLAGLAAIVVATARPVATIPVPADRSAIVLAMDVSGSMRSTDVLPNRLAAAQEAARVFVATVPKTVRIGLVAFGGYPVLLVPPGTDRERLIEAIGGLSRIYRTAIGEGLLEAVAALPGRVRANPDGTLPPLPPGPRHPGVVILLSDGRSNTGIDALKAAAIARQQEVLVYTVGVGQPVTPEGAWTLGGPLDEAELQAIAQAAEGRYFRATSAEGLSETYQRLARAVGWERRREEMTGIAGMLGAVVIIASMAVARVVTHPLRT
jgi:Ca-activated chloride channel family protein